ADSAGRPPALDRVGAGPDLRVLRLDAQDRSAGRTGRSDAGNPGPGSHRRGSPGLVDGRRPQRTGPGQPLPDWLAAAGRAPDRGAPAVVRGRRTTHSPDDAGPAAIHRADPAIQPGCVAVPRAFRVRATGGLRPD